jgi:cytosine/creatinine deaminase
VTSLPATPPDAVHGDPAAQPLLLRRMRLAIGGVADVLLADGKIAAVGGYPVGQPAPAEVLDLRGYLLLPSLAEPHVHLDKAFTAAGIGNPDGSLRGVTGAWAAARPGLSAAGITCRAWKAVTRYLTHGTTAFRAHVDVGGEVGLWAVHALLDVRSGLAAAADIEIVAQASGPVTGRAGATNRSLLRDAMAAGADLVGGAPALDDDPRGAVDALAAIAADAATGLDLHVDETTDPVAGTLPRLITIAEAGFGYPITASHVVSLGVQAPERRRAAAQSLAHAGIGVVTLPQTGLFLQGRGMGAAAPRGLTAVPELLDAGVRLAAGGGNLQDPVNPMGRADPLETASLLVVGAHLTPAEAFAAVTSAARHIMRLPDVTILPGAPADLVAVRAADLGGAVASGTPDRIVLRGGQVVARTWVSSELAVEEPSWNASSWTIPRPRPAR